ncbi:MAG: Gfo/Idh/MocA family oxidoreductase [Solirubrobacterales bacterium]|nr:Gfo/Idh/MocA family oxidoreductase [Solirubrobacterales bacterium]
MVDVAIKWGIMSTARINRLFLAGARQARGVEIAAVASREQSSARRFADEQQIARAYGSYEALLADPEIEAVYISLPNSLHIEWTRRALIAGKHVLCEKPLSRRAAEVVSAFDLAGQRERLLMEAFMYRHHPQTRRLQELVGAGAVGRVRLIRGSFSFFAGDAGNIRLNAALDGGALMDVGCYCVSGARLIAGEPERVSAEQALGSGRVDVVFTGVMRFGDDVLAHFDAGLALPIREELEIVGERGALFLGDPWHCRMPVIELRRDGEVERIEIEPVDPYMLEAENMSAAIRGEAQPLLGRDDAIGQARAIEALYQAGGSGRVVEL